MKRNTLKYLAFSIFPFFVLVAGNVFAEDISAHVFSSQTASGTWSSSSKISVDSNLEYINRWNNSSIIWNYFSWYYYDTILWFFETDWSSSLSENVRVVWSTPKCGTSYGYKLWGYAYSATYGFVDFDYNDDIYVYYCVGDSQLYWYSYSEQVWFQDFEWITFPIAVEWAVIPDTPTGSWSFANEGVDTSDNSIWEDPPDGEAVNSNFTPNTIQNDVIEFDVDRESLFYIIK